MHGMHLNLGHLYKPTFLNTLLYIYVPLDCKNVSHKWATLSALHLDILSNQIMMAHV